MTPREIATIISDSLRNQLHVRGATLSDDVICDAANNAAQALVGMCEEDERELAAIDAENWRRELNEPRVTVDVDQMWRPGC